MVISHQDAIRVLEERRTDPIRGSAAHLTGILTDHRLPDTA